MNDKINTIIESLKELTLIELYQLIKNLEIIFEITNLPMVSPISDNVNTTITLNSVPTVKELQEKVSFNIILNEIPSDKKIGVLKIIRASTGLGLKECKEIIDNLPQKIKENITKEECDKLKLEFENLGAQIIIE